jgi:hypothetical protein
VARFRQQCTHLNGVKNVSPCFEPGEDWSWCFIDEIEVVLK